MPGGQDDSRDPSTENSEGARRAMLVVTLNQLTPAQLGVMLVLATILKQTNPDDAACAEQAVLLQHAFENGVRVGLAGGRPRRGEA
jgi:hypothetical protein